MVVLGVMVRDKPKMRLDHEEAWKPGHRLDFIQQVIGKLPKRWECENHMITAGLWKI